MQHERRIERMKKRREQGLTFREIGEEVDLSAQHVGRLLRGRNPLPEEYDEE